MENKVLDEVCSSDGGGLDDRDAGAGQVGYRRLTTQAARLRRHAWEALDDERLAEGVSQTEWAQRCGEIRQNLVRDFNQGRDMRLSSLAKRAHALNRRVVLVLMEEVPE